MSGEAVKISDLVARGALYYSDGYRTKRDELAATGYRILRAGDISAGRLSLGGADHVHEDRSHQIGAKSALDGDILLTTKGTVGKVARVQELGTQRVVYSPQLCFFRVLKQDLIDPAFFGLCLESPLLVSQMRTYSGNSDMAPYLNLRDIGALTILLPTISAQQSIAEVLGALDDKIEANRRVIERADALRRALWMHAVVGAARVPLSELAQFVNGGALTKGASGTGRPVIRIAEMRGGISRSTVRSDIEVRDDLVVRRGDYLMSWSGSLGAVRWFGEEGILNQHIFKVLPNDDSPLWAVACAVEWQLPYFQFTAANKATTMGHIQRHHLDEDVPWPSISDDLGSRGYSLWNLALAREIENTVLASTRDELLPLLMNGKITVRDAELVAEEVL